MKKAEMHPAYSWVCSECGTLNFIAGKAIELSAEDIEELKDELGIEVYEEGSFYKYPNTCKCSECKEEFECQHHSEPTELEDDEEDEEDWGLGLDDDYGD